jgi:hypothetical protein
MLLIDYTVHMGSGLLSLFAQDRAGWESKYSFWSKATSMSVIVMVPLLLHSIFAVL